MHTHTCVYLCAHTHMCCVYRQAFAILFLQAFVFLVTFTFKAAGWWYNSVAVLWVPSPFQEEKLCVAYTSAH